LYQPRERDAVELFAKGRQNGRLRDRLFLFHDQLPRPRCATPLSP
jgi:hypothetical protein